MKGYAGFDAILDVDRCPRQQTRKKNVKDWKMRGRQARGRERVKVVGEGA